jgi:hypothetical protein
VPTATAIASANIAAAGLGTLKRRSPIFIDFLKVAAGVTINVYGCSTTTVLVDYRPDHLLSGVDQLGTPVINGQTMTVLLTASTALSISGAMGNPNSLCFYWSSYQFPMELYALAASVISSPLTAYEEDYSGAIETFDLYNAPGVTGTVDASTLSSGSGWTAAPVFYGTAFNANMLMGQAGTSVGSPDEPFQQYYAGTVYSGTLINAGTGWASTSAIYGYSNPGTYAGLYGTIGYPNDGFEQYGTGAVTSDVTVSSGTGWVGAALVI